MGRRTSVPKSIGINKKIRFMGTQKKPPTGRPTKKPNRPDELDVLLYGFILLTLKWNQRPGTNDTHTVPEQTWSLLPTL